MGSNKIFKPSILITSSRRPSRLTNTFMKALSAIFNSPIVRRGRSNLDHIALIAKEEGFKGFLIVYTRKGNPYIIDFYSLKNTHYSLDLRLFMLGVYINRKFRGPFGSIKLVLKGVSEGSKQVYESLKRYFKQIEREEEVYDSANAAEIIIDDLTYIDQKKYSKLANDVKFKPSEIKILNTRGEPLLRIKVHHVIKYLLE